jgi:uncharacterized membrane protein YgcG
MEYITLDNQQNKYPTIVNYVTSNLLEITLTGNYTTNKISFGINSLSNVVAVKDTTFKFLLSIEGSNKIYTSPLYYNQLAASVDESNPYFIEGSFKPEFIVNYTIADISQIINELKAAEKLKNVIVSKNVFILENGVYDYQELVKYIDWVVSPVALNDLGTNNVLPLSEISDYTLPEIEKPTNNSENLPNANEVVEENIQVYQWEYIRKRNLKNEPFAVRETKNTTSREVYRINEGNKFIGNYIDNSLFEIFDDGRTARVGYIDVPQSKLVRFKQVAGPFNVKVLTIKQPSNPTTPSANTPNPSNPTMRGGSGGGGASGGSGGGPSYGGGYNDDMNRNNVRYDQR